MSWYGMGVQATHTQLPSVPPWGPLPQHAGGRLPEASSPWLWCCFVPWRLCPGWGVGRLWGGRGCAGAPQGARTLAHSCHLQQQEWQRPRCGD